MDYILSLNNSLLPNSDLGNRYCARPAWWSFLKVTPLESMELTKFPSDEALQRLFRSGKLEPYVQVSLLISNIYCSPRYWFVSAFGFYNIYIYIVFNICESLSFY